MQDGLLLRDVHRPPAPPLWPPAPGWWFVAAAVVLLVVIFFAWRRHRARRHLRITRLFDDAIAGSSSPSERLARSSGMLRRAARARRPDADRLDGEDWLAFLDTPRTPFLDGPGRLLLDGPFRPHIDAAESDAAVALARRRFVELVGLRR